MKPGYGLLCIVLIGIALGIHRRAGTLPGAVDDPAFVLPDDLEVTLWAESPMFFNPTNIDVDVRGRIWVAEAVNYRDFNNKDLPLREGGDRIMILEDTDGDGVADASKVFVQDPDLRAPLGLAVIGNQVIVSSSPSLIVYTDNDGDDRPDHKETLLTGFGGYDHDHSLHALLAGPDGQWYFNVGNAGPHIVTDRSGWTLRSGSVYRGGSPYNLDNVPGLTSDDGRRWVGGLALRMRPDGSGLTVLGHNFRNAYELTIDSYGNLWGTLIMADKIFALTPEGEQRILLDDGNAEASRALEEAFQRDDVTPDHMLAATGTIAPWTASITFGGPDLRTVYVGSLRGTRIPYFQSPVAGLPMVHW